MGLGLLYLCRWTCKGLAHESFTLTSKGSRMATERTSTESLFLVGLAGILKDIKPLSD